MLWEKIKVDDVPNDYEFKNTRLYNELREKEKDYNYKILLFLLSFVFLFFMFLGLKSIIYFNSKNIIINFTSGLLNLVFLIFFIKKREDAKFPKNIYIFYFISLLLTLIWSNEYGYYILLFYFLQLSLIVSGILTEKLIIASFFVSSAAISLSIYFKRDIKGYEEVNKIEYILPFVLIYVYILKEKYRLMKKDLLKEILVDGYTGLPNREVLLKTKLKTDTILCLIKISNFKDLLMNFGYDIAEEIFIYSSKKIKEINKDYKYNCYKMTGNEYAMLIPLYEEFTEQELIAKVREIILKMQEESMKWRGTDIKLSYNTGASVMKLVEDNIKIGLSKSDSALKTAIKDNRDIVVYNESLHKNINQIDSIIKFTTIIENKEESKFEAEFQPVYDIDKKNIIFYETFTKINSRDGKKKSILNYMEIAKATGSYRYISDFSIQKAYEFAIDKKTDVSINISIEDISNEQYRAALNEYMEKFKSKNKKLYIEISEKYINEAVVKENINKYNFITDNFDDFNLNINEILNNESEIIKIDAEIIKNALKNEYFKNILKNIVMMLKNKNKKTIAKCIDDEKIYMLSKEIGIDMVQGYYIKEPKSKEEI